MKIERKLKKLGYKRDGDKYHKKYKSLNLYICPPSEEFGGGKIWYGAISPNNGQFEDMLIASSIIRSDLNEFSIWRRDNEK